MPELHAGSERHIAGLHKLSAVSGRARNCLLTERRGGCIIRRCLCSDTAGRFCTAGVCRRGRVPRFRRSRNDSVRHRRQQPDPGRKGVRHDGAGTTPRAVPRPLRAVTRGHAPRQSITYRERGVPAAPARCATGQATDLPRLSPVYRLAPEGSCFAVSGKGFSPYRAGKGADAAGVCAVSAFSPVTGG